MAVIENNREQLASIINDEDLTALNQEAEKVIEQMQSRDDASLDAMLHKLADLGAEEQRMAGDTLSSMRRPVNHLYSKDNPQNEVPDTLLKLRDMVNDLDPNSIEQKGIKGLIGKILRKNPLDKYMAKYQSIDKSLEVIIGGLLRGRDRLQEDNAELEMIRKDCLEKIYSLKKQVFLGMSIDKRLEDEKKKTEWSEKANVILDAQQKIMTRTQNMSTMINVLLQCAGSTDAIKKTNEQLKEEVRNALDISKNILPIAASIQIYIQNQGKLIKTLQSVKDATTNIIMTNARNLKENAEKTTKMLETPFMSIEDQAKAMRDVADALSMQAQSAQRIVDSSRDYVKKNELLSQEFEKKLIK